VPAPADEETKKPSSEEVVGDETAAGRAPRCLYEKRECLWLTARFVGLGAVSQSSGMQ
jgi:hypothetical protein